MSAISLTVAGATEADRRASAEAASGLIRELRTRAGMDARPVTGTSGDGQKSGTAMTIGELIVSGVFSTATMSALATVAVAYIRRGAARTITMTDGKRSFTISDPSPDTERAAVEWLRDSAAGKGAVDNDSATS